jgi:hypothetical protein
MKQQGNMTPQKANDHITKELNNSEVDAMSNIELRNDDKNDQSERICLITSMKSKRIQINS